MGHLHGFGGLPVDGRRGRRVPAVDLGVDDGGGSSQAKQGIDLSTFKNALANKELYPAPPTVSGQEINDTITPLFQGYFSGRSP